MIFRNLRVIFYFLKAVQKSNVDVVLTMLNATYVDVNTQDNLGATPLIYSNKFHFKIYRITCNLFNLLSMPYK